MNRYKNNYLIGALFIIISTVSFTLGYVIENIPYDGSLSLLGLNILSHILFTTGIVFYMIGCIIIIRN